LDHLGSPRLELDAAGTLVAEHHYLPFGDEKPSQIDPSINNKAFTGHQRDGETGLDYMLARYYGSSLGRFQSPDPGNDTDPEDPQSWNMYTYVRNNPVLLIDPDGRKIKYDYKKQDGSKDRKANRAAKTAIKKAAKADPKLKAKYKQLKKSDNVFTVTNRKPGKGNEARPDSSANAQNGIGTGGTFTVDPYDTRDPETGGTRDVSVAMTHEVLAHGTDYDSGTLDQTEDIPGVPRSEIKAVRTENIMRPYTRDPIRTTFGGHPVPDPTADP
jgi:RHS repeat-associated protein